MLTDTEKLILHNQRVTMIALWEIFGSQPSDNTTKYTQRILSHQIEQTESVLMMRSRDGYDDQPTQQR